MTSNDIKMTSYDLKETSKESVKSNRKSRLKGGMLNYDNSIQGKDLFEQIFFFPINGRVYRKYEKKTLRFKTR